MNKFFKRLLFFAVLTIGVMGIYIYQAGYHPAILMYHQITEENAKTSALVVDPFYFEKQMQFLKEHHYNVLPLEEFIAQLKTRKRLPFKTVTLTLDDGNLDNYTNAYPILKKYNLPATIFLVTNWIEKPHFLTWKQIQEMEQNNIRFGNHTLHHAHLPSLSFEEAKKEIIENKIVLNTHLQHPLPIVCYPFGGYTVSIQNFLKENGYLAALATSSDGFSALDDLYALRRVRISKSSNSLFIFWIETSGYYGWIRQMQKKLKKWKKSWKKS